MKKNNKLIIVTGGMGYIGSHTIVELIKNGYDVISIDNFSNSHKLIQKRLSKVCNQKIQNLNIDITNYQKVFSALKKLNRKIDGIIHFAAFKAVGESVSSPIKYYENNLNSTITILKICTDFNIKSLIFSSSCTVYGTPNKIPVTEKTPIKIAQSPYGATKQMCETIIQDYATIKKCKCIFLRYFNPAGAHKSLEIGELPLQKPQNLVPVITQTAIGKIRQLKIFGNDYHTKDGSCIRDFIHITDLANAHVKAIEYSKKRECQSYEIFNIGTGQGTSVLTMIKTFMKYCTPNLKYNISHRRPGDVEKIYSVNTKAKKKLNWKPQLTIKDILTSAWEWEKKLSKNEFR